VKYWFLNETEMPLRISLDEQEIFKQVIELPEESKVYEFMEI